VFEHEAPVASAPVPADSVVADSAGPSRAPRRP